MEAIILSTLEEIKEELLAIRSDIVLLSFDVEQIRKQLDKLEQVTKYQNSEPIGIAPNTPPIDFLPPEYE
jgi:hypothetical protein